MLTGSFFAGMYKVNVEMIAVNKDECRGMGMRKRSFSLRQKLILSFVLVVVLPVSLVGLTLTRTLRERAEEQALQEALASIERVKRHVNGAMRQAMVLSARFFVDRELEAVLGRTYSSTWDVVSAYLDYTDFDVYPEISSEIAMIRTYAPNPTLLDNWRIMRATDEITSSEWYQQAVQHRGKISWRYLWFPELEKGYFSLVRQITGINPVGVLTISLNPEYLSSILAQESFETMLLDDEGRIIASSERGLVGQLADEVIGGLTAANGQQAHHISYRGRLYHAMVDQISQGELGSKLRIVSLFPSEYIMAKTREVNLSGFLIVGISLLLSFGLILVLSRVLTARLQRLSEGAHRVAAGDLGHSLLMKGSDEISTLSQDLTKMVQSIQLLYHQKEQLEIGQREIQFRMLANQINPHFLFNVLETIRMRALINGADEVAEIVHLLGKILRRNLELGPSPVPLREELDIVQSYLQIQRFRFGDRLQFTFKIEPEVEEFPILPLLLQPLVENAVVHGLEGKEGPGVVALAAEQDDGFVRIRVCDDGVGMQSAQLEKLGKLLSSEAPPPDRIGIHNVFQRIRLYYGETAKFEVTSREGMGTEVTLLLPWTRGSSP